MGIRNLLKGYKMITAHIVFDDKYDGRKRAGVVGRGHRTDAPVDVSFTGIVSLKIVRVIIFITMLNRLDICVYEIGSAYLEAFTKEKLYIIPVPEFKEHAGHILLINKALYGLRTSDARWMETLADFLLQLGWKQTQIDPVVWIKDQGTHYKYLIVWVDDMLIMAKKPMDTINQLSQNISWEQT